MCRRFVLFSLVAALALTTAAQGARIIWVADNLHYGSVEPNMPADQGFIALLTAQGHEVIYKDQHDPVDGTQYWRELDPNKIAELEAADLIIIARDCASGKYSEPNEAEMWNSITTPILMQGPHIARALPKWGWFNSTGTEAGNVVAMQVLDPNHPLFQGVELDPNNQVNVLADPIKSEFMKGAIDAGNGTVLATRADNGLVWIALWETGQEYFAGSTQIAGGPRMFLASGAGGNKNNQVDGVYNLTAAGEKIFLNAVNFLLPPAPLADDFLDTFEAARNYLAGGLGAYAGTLGAFDMLDANSLVPGALYMQTTAAWWDPGPGPMLYVNVTGDFVATVKVVGFAGTMAERVFNNDCGIVARDPAGGAGTENWVAVNYFPTWTGFVARNTTNSGRRELGQTAGAWLGADTFAIAQAYPWIQLERRGADFFFRISADGVSFLPLTDPAYKGIYDPNDPNQAPLVVHRPDLPPTLQVGLVNATYDVTTGFVAFDNFTVTLPRTEVTVGSAADTWMVKDDPNAHGEQEYMVVHGGSLDRTGYVRFDLSGLNLQSIKSATLTLFVHGSIPKPPYRNDSCVTGRFALYGLNNVAGNTAQDWDQAVLTSAATGAEMDWATGAVVTADGRTVDLDDGVAGITEAVAPTGSPGNASLGAAVTITGDALVSFLQSRVDDNGLVTFLLKNDDGSDRGYGLCTREFADEAYRPKLELTAIVKP